MSSKEYFQDYYRRHREKYIAKAKRWKKNNPEARARHVISSNVVQRKRRGLLHVRAAHIWRGAKKRGKEFTITVADVETLLRATSTCPYTGQPLDFSVSETKGWRSPWAPSLDRVDNSKGYVLGNLEITSVWWNTAKHHWTPDVMRTAIDGLLRNRTMLATM